jgi:hypothetical protein
VAVIKLKLHRCRTFLTPIPSANIILIFQYKNCPQNLKIDADWIVQQLEYFQSGERQNSYMNAMAPMAEGFERSIAEYLSIQNSKY